MCGSLRTWRGEPLPSFLEVQGFRADIIRRFRKRRWSKIAVKTLSFSGQPRIDIGLFAKPIPIFIDEGNDAAGQRILAADWGNEDTGLWIKTTDPRATLQCLGNPANVIFVRDLPLPQRPPRAARQAMIQVMDRYGRKTEHVTGIMTEGWFVGKHVQHCRLFDLLDLVGINIDQVFCLSPGMQKQRAFRNLRPLEVGPVDPVRAKRHEAVLAIKLHHPDLRLPLHEAGDELHYHRQQLRQLLGLSTEQGSDPLLERYPLLPHLNLCTVKTADLQHYIDRESGL